MEIRAACESDVANMLALIRGKAEFDGCLESLQADEEEIRRAFFSAQPKAQALLALSEGAVVGIATYYDIYSTFIAKPGIWLDDLFVKPENRTQGVGKALLRALCEVAERKGCGRIDWIVARDNQNGRDFYQSVGAEIFEQVRHARLDEQAINALAYS